jgi:thiamine-phosphate pyrophosphorylase
MKDKMVSLQFIMHHNERYSYIDSAKLVLAGGCRWIQLRMKDAILNERRSAALQIQKLCKEYNATFIIDDDVDLTKEIHADGVHLGLNDMPIDEARRILGKDFIIGGTANTYADIEKHWKTGADYIGCGPFRYTQTKKNLSAILGIDGYRHIIDKVKEHQCPLPIIAIGGITYNDIPLLMTTGISGIAVSGTILNASCPITETRKLINL